MVRNARYGSLIRDSNGVVLVAFKRCVKLEAPVELTESMTIQKVIILANEVSIRLVDGHNFMLRAQIYTNIILNALKIMKY